MSTRSIFRTVLWFGLISLLVSLIPVLVYWCQFKKTPISTDPEDWGMFGDYVSGISGTFLTFLAVLFSLSSLYFTAKISKQIQDDEFKFNQGQADKQLETLRQQNKPYPFIHLTKYNKLIGVTLQNMGLGPLVIKKWKVVYDGKEDFKSFRHLLQSKFHTTKRHVKYHYNSSPEHILGPNTKKKLLRVQPDGEASPEFESDYKELKSILIKTEIFVEYEDVFGNKFKINKKLDFFH